MSGPASRAVSTNLTLENARILETLIKFVLFHCQSLKVGSNKSRLQLSMVLVSDLVLCVMAQGSLRSLGPTHIFTTGPSTSTMLSA